MTFSSIILNLDGFYIDIAAQLENVKRSISEEKIKLEKLFKLKHELEMENASLVDSTSKKNTETTETNWTSNGKKSVI